MIGWRVHDVMRTIDWIQTRKSSTQRASAAWDQWWRHMHAVLRGARAAHSRRHGQRLSVHLQDSVFSLSHCIDNYVPGILNWAEMYDVAGLIAPRPLFAESVSATTSSRSKPAAPVSRA